MDESVLRNGTAEEYLPELATLEQLDQGGDGVIRMSEWQRWLEKAGSVISTRVCPQGDCDDPRQRGELIPNLDLRERQPRSEPPPASVVSRTCIGIKTIVVGY